MSGIITEKQLQEGLQAWLQTLTAFENANVVINDYTLLDDNVGVTPIAIIANTDTFSNIQSAGVRSTGTIPIPCTLAVRFFDWKETLDLFRDTRQAILDLFSSGGARGLSLDGVSVDTVTAASAVDYIGLDNGSELPVWITQVFDINIELF